MNLELTGDLSLGPGKKACGGEVGNTTGPVHSLALTGENQSPDAMSGLYEQTIDSDNAQVALPFDPMLAATVTYLQTLGGAEFSVTFTFADDATSTLGIKGMALIEHNPDNPVTGISVQGSGKLRWLATGEIA